MQLHSIDNMITDNLTNEYTHTTIATYIQVFFDEENLIDFTKKHKNQKIK